MNILNIQYNIEYSMRNVPLYKKCCENSSSIVKIHKKYSESIGKIVENLYNKATFRMQLALLLLSFLIFLTFYINYPK